MYPWFLGLKFAFSYFTVLPVSFKEKDDLSKKAVLASMLFFLPFVGLVLGMITIMIGSFEGWLPALIASVLYMILYGFIHTEAVCDVADALYAKHAGKDPYIVIKEPTIGAMGLFYGIAFFLLKVATIVALFLDEKFIEFLAIVLISRLCLLILITLLSFQSTFINRLKKTFKKSHLAASLIVYSFIGLGLMGSTFLLYLAFGTMLAYMIARFVGRQLGFINGDVLGVTLESVEIILFILIGAIHVI